jgi:hypothetical protein
VFSLKIACDQTCTFVEGQVRPSPLKEHEQAIAEADKEDDVHE